MVAHGCNPSTWEVGQGYPELKSQHAIHETLYLKKKIKCIARLLFLAVLDSILSVHWILYCLNIIFSVSLRPS